MEFRNENNYKGIISDSGIKECFRDYKLQDKVDALTNVLGLNNNRTIDHRKKSIRTNGANRIDNSINECLSHKPITSTFQTLVSELRDTTRNSYWNKEIGKSAYLVPNLPAGCDPLNTTFGKATIRQEHGVAEILNTRNDIIDTDQASQKAQQKKVYDASKRGDVKSFAKIVGNSGEKMVKCLKWINTDHVTLVKRNLADFSNRTKCRLGKVRNREAARKLDNFTFGVNSDKEVEAVADVLRESSASELGSDIYCSVYANEISKHCGSLPKKIAAAGISSEKSHLSKSKLTDDESSAKALISPNVFTQMSLSHREFFKIRSYEEIRSIFENIGVEFPNNSFDVLWNEGLKIDDCAGGVSVETLRNLLGRLAMHSYIDDRA